MANNIYPVQFTGTGKEYFRIWIVNIALSLITLGIYSAWAKVRTKRWFYSHTLIDNHPFVYHAKPLQILKGRLIMLAFLAVNWLVVIYGTAAATYTILIIQFLATPWLVVHNLKFNARNSSYRGIHFSFTGSTKDAARYFIGGDLFTIITLGFAFPYIAHRKKHFIINQYWYGKTRMRVYFKIHDQFWHIYINTVAKQLVYFVFYLIIYAVISFSTRNHLFMATVLKYFGMLFIYWMIWTSCRSIKAKLANLIYNNSTVGNVSFVSTQVPSDLIKFSRYDTFFILLTLGLYIPWAKVRRAKYHAKHLHIHSTDTLENFMANTDTQVITTGNKLADAFDLDLSIY